MSHRPEVPADVQASVSRLIALHGVDVVVSAVAHDLAEGLICPDYTDENGHKFQRRGWAMMVWSLYNWIDLITKIRDTFEGDY